MWILFVVIFWNSHGVAVDTGAKFKTEEYCLAAEKKITKEMEEFTNRSIIVCVEQ